MVNKMLAATKFYAPVYEQIPKYGRENLVSRGYFPDNRTELTKTYYKNIDPPS
jgi:hypothetical protein